MDASCCSHSRSCSRRSDLPATLLGLCGVLSMRVCTREVSLQAHASLFETSVQARAVTVEGSNTRELARSEPLLSQRSFECSRSETLLLRRSFECADEAPSSLAAKPGEYSKPRPHAHSKLRCDHCQSFDPCECAECGSLLFFSWSHHTDSHDCAHLTLCLLELWWQVCV